MARASSTYYVYPTAHGPVTIAATSRGVCKVVFGEAALEGERKPSDFTNRAATELQEYLAGKRKTFGVPIDMWGSSFQKAVWTEVCEVPYGEVRSAAQIAEALGKPGSHRSVGSAIKRCELAPFVPVHRVTAANATGKQAKVFRAFVALEARSV